MRTPNAAAATERRPRSSSWGPAVGTLALLGAVVLFEIPVCPCALLLGVPCPGCGLGRASLALMTGDVGQALRLHPLVPIALPGAVAAITLSSRPRTPSHIHRRLGTAASALLLALLLAVWVARFAGAFGGPVPVDGPLWAGLRR